MALSKGKKTRVKMRVLGESERVRVCGKERVYEEEGACDSRLSGGLLVWECVVGRESINSSFLSAIIMTQANVH